MRARVRTAHFDSCCSTFFKRTRAYVYLLFCKIHIQDYVNTFRKHLFNQLRIIVPKMATEIRRYCFCSSNLKSAKILGAIGMALAVFSLIYWIGIAISDPEITPAELALPLFLHLVALFANGCLVVGIKKGSKALLFLWIVLSLVSIVFDAYFLKVTCEAEEVSLINIWVYLLSIGLNSWTILVVISAVQEIEAGYECY